MTGWVEALTVGDILGVLVTLGVVAGGLRWLKPVLKGVRDFLVDWGGEPERPGVPRRPGVVESLGELRCDMEGMKTDMAKVKDDAAQAAFHSQPNHGSSSHDALMREMRETRRVVSKLEDLVLSVSRKQAEQAEHQDAFELAVRESIADRAEIREHIGLPLPEMKEPQ